MTEEQRRQQRLRDNYNSFMLQHERRMEVVYEMKTAHHLSRDEQRRRIDAAAPKWPA